MAELEKEKKLAEIANMPQWHDLKKMLREQIDRVCDIEKISSFEEMVGAKFCKKVYNELVRKIDGAKDVINFE